MSSTWRLSRAFVKMYRDEALVGQDMCCRYCRDALTYRTSTVEHRIPRSRHGDSRRKNIAATCQPCNTAKGSMTDSEFMALLQREPSDRSKAIRACWRRRSDNLRKQVAAKRAGKVVADAADQRHRKPKHDKHLERIEGDGH